MSGELAHKNLFDLKTMIRKKNKGNTPINNTKAAGCCKHMQKAIIVSWNQDFTGKNSNKFAYFSSSNR